jgi:peptidoglycan/xylan/chitin deacetylase (PgdA/CDA1 family)
VTTIASHQQAFRAGQFIRVVNYHSTPGCQAGQLEKELAAYAEMFAPVTMDDLDGLFETGAWHKGKPGVIPVFYEGYRNSATVAAPACEAVGLTGWFPVATQFIATPVAHQEAFARAHWISLVEEDLRGEPIAMTWDQVAALSQRHEIYPHTASHEGFDTIHDTADLEREVFEPKRLMEKATGKPARAFAWLHGSPYGRSPLHDRALVDAGYDFLFSNTMIQRLPTHPN